MVAVALILIAVLLVLHELREREKDRLVFGFRQELEDFLLKTIREWEMDRRCYLCGADLGTYSSTDNLCPTCKNKKNMNTICYLCGRDLTAYTSTDGLCSVCKNSVNPKDNTPVGWKCPECGVVNAPFVTRCDCQKIECTVSVTYQQNA